MSKGRGAKRVPGDAAEEALVRQGRCPNGHVLPNRTNAGYYTPLKCAGKVQSKAEKAAGKKETAMIPRALSDLKSVAEVEEEQRVRLQERVNILEAKRKFFGVPRALTGQEADEWIDRRLMELGVEAVAELEEQLKLGGPEDRRITAFRILDAIGKGKKENQPLPPATIILQVAPNNLPWARETKTVEAQVVPAPALKDGGDE